MASDSHDGLRALQDDSPEASAPERHSHRPRDALFAATLGQLEKRWQSLEGSADPTARGWAAAALLLNGSSDTTQEPRWGRDFGIGTWGR